MSTTTTVRLAYPAAIPVGHRVQVTWHLHPGGAWGTKRKPRPHEPVLADLETGVRYAPASALGDFVGYRSNTPNAYGHEPLADREVEEILIGTVVACTIVHVSLSEPYQQTVLTIAADG